MNYLLDRIVVQRSQTGLTVKRVTVASCHDFRELQAYAWQLCRASFAFADSVLVIERVAAVGRAGDVWRLEGGVSEYLTAPIRPAVRVPAYA